MKTTQMSSLLSVSKMCVHFFPQRNSFQHLILNTISASSDILDRFNTDRDALKDWRHSVQSREIQFSKPDCELSTQISARAEILRPAAAQPVSFISKFSVRAGRWRGLREWRTPEWWQTSGMRRALTPNLAALLLCTFEVKRCLSECTVV